VKSDTCNTDCGIHDGCLQNSTKAMSDALYASGRPIVYYVDSGNPTSPQRVFNPHNRNVHNEECLVKVALRPRELVWRWAADTAHAFKSWFDIDDTYRSTLTNAHNQIRVAEYQSCGTFNTPDMLTIGQGGQSFAEYRTQFYLWAVLGAPLILGADLRNLTARELDLVTGTPR
jgi:alpha-galactosidase